MSPDRKNPSSVAHKSAGETLQSLPEPEDPVGNTPDYLTFKTDASLQQAVTANTFGCPHPSCRLTGTEDWKRTSGGYTAGLRRDIARDGFSHCSQDAAQNYD